MSLLQCTRSSVPRALLFSNAALRSFSSFATASARDPAPSPSHEAILIDAAGTLVLPSEPAAEVYQMYAQKYGCQLSSEEILARFRKAYSMPWGDSPSLRYVGDGRGFWRRVVGYSTQCDSEALFEEVYQHYERPGAWTLSPGAAPALQRLKDSGLKLAVVSNFDTRLRPILHGLGVGDMFDELIVSAEVGVEKPNPFIFEIALERLKVVPGNALHVGDDRRNDVWGARDAGVEAWLWGLDVHNFEELADRVLLGLDRG